VTQRTLKVVKLLTQINLQLEAIRVIRATKKGDAYAPPNNLLVKGI